MKQLKDRGTSLSVIATLYRTNEASVKELIRCVEAGEKPRWPTKSSTKSRGPRRESKEKKIPKYIRHSELVARLRDEEKMPFGEIGKCIYKQFKDKLSYSTIVNAYDHAHFGTLQAAAQNGQTPNRGRVVLIGEEKYRDIRRLLLEGIPGLEVARRVGCGRSTVGRERQRMKDAGVLA